MNFQGAGRMIMIKFNLIMKLIAIFLLSAATLVAQDKPEQVTPSVKVHGQATVSVAPDQAQFDIGVVTQAATAKAAADKNATQSDALVHELTSAFPSAVINTVNYSVNPNYRYPVDSAPTIAGYTANNTVRLLLNDISRLQTVLDIAIKAGASSINRLTFTLKNENSARAQALGEAASQAQAGAESLAVSLKLKLKRLLTVEEGQPVIVSPPREISFEKLQSTNLAPIVPGTIDVHADVDITYESTPASEKP
jgi:uncharacterized protein YggE